MAKQGRANMLAYAVVKGLNKYHHLPHTIGSRQERTTRFFFTLGALHYKAPLQFLRRSNDFKCVLWSEKSGNWMCIQNLIKPKNKCQNADHKHCDRFPNKSNASTKLTESGLYCSIKVSPTFTG